MDDASWCLSFGVSLHATGDGLVVEGDRSWRVRLNDAQLERRIVDMLAVTGNLDRLVRELSPERLAPAIRELRQIGALVPRRRRITIFDQLGVEVRLSAEETRQARAPSDIGDSELVVICARREDASIGAALERCAALALPALLVWTSPGEVVAVFDDPRVAPCARCALAFDGKGVVLAGRHQVASETTVHSVHDQVERSFATAVVARYAERLEPLEPGRASVWNLLEGHSAMEGYVRHPACRCSTRTAKEAAHPPSASWELLEGRRFRPVTPLRVDGNVARAAYRAARDPWPLTPRSFGITLAAGKACRERAIGEAVERFAMFHAPPAVRSCCRRELPGEALSSEDIGSLLFRNAEYGSPAFRFPRFSDDLPVDWSWGVRASSGQRLLVPTSLIGRAPAAGVRLADATSNGYAAHRSDEDAKVGALLEVIERDALLMNWYLGNSLERIDTMMRGALLLLASSDVGLPVVVAARLTGDGLRLGTAAALSFDVAVEHALDELDGQVASVVAGPDVDLWREDRGYGPTDHLAHYAAEHGRALFESWMAGGAVHTAVELRARWPESTEAPLPRVLGALELAGLDAIFVDRSLPEVFGPGWSVVRAIVPGAVEMSWGMLYRRLGSPRVTDWLASGAVLSSTPHPYA